MKDLEARLTDISLILDVVKDDVELNTPLAGNESWDSFARLAAVALISKHSGRSVTLDDLAKLSTVADLVALVNDTPTRAS